MLVEEASFDGSTSRLLVQRQVVFPDGGSREWQISIRLYAVHELRNVMRALQAVEVKIVGPPAFRGIFLGAPCAEQIVMGRWASPRPPA